MKKLIFVISAILISAGLSFGQNQQQTKTATKTETKTEVKKGSNSTNGAMAHNTHHHKTTATKKTMPKK